MSVAGADPLLGALLLAVAGWALAAAGVRVASVLAPAGLDRLLAAIVLAVAAACLQGLGLGLIGLGADPYLLTVAAVLTFAAARAALPAPALGLAAELGHWWSVRSASQRAVLGALTAVSVAWAGWMLQHPFLGEDGVRYRLPTVIEWIGNGSPGSLYAASADYATDAYPLGNELLLAWPMAIARSFVAASVWSPLAVVLTAAAGWHLLRRLRAPGPVAGAAIAAVLLTPLNIGHINEPGADLPALAWAACCAALCTGAARRPGLLAPAALAAALAMGAKTTALVPVAVALAAGLYSARGSLRPVRGVLLAGGAAAVVLGGFWYARNLVLHGSPLWPFRAAPWGDPSPPLIEALDHSLLERPRVTLRGRTDLYVDELSGALVLMAGALAAPLLNRSRAVLGLSAAAGVALLAYAAAPVTGLGDAGLVGFPLLSLRYLLPALGVCAAAIAVAATRGDRRVARGAFVVLAASALWSAIDSLELDFPIGPPVGTLWPAAIMGGGLALAMGAAVRRVPRTLARPAAVAGVLLVALLAALPARGYVKRAAAMDAAPLVAVPRFFSSAKAPGPTTPVLYSTTPDARVAGDRLRRPQRLLEDDLPCAAYRRGWLVLTNSSGALNGVRELKLPLGPLERCRYPDPAVAGVPGQALVYRPR